MGNKRNTEAIIIVVLVVLLVGVVGYLVWNMYFTNKEIVTTHPQANNGQTGTSNTDIDNVYKELRQEVEAKNSQIATLKEENEKLKKQENKTETVIKNEFVQIKATVPSEFETYVVGPFEASYADGILSFYLTEKGEVKAEVTDISVEGSKTLKRGEVYTVNNLKKKVVGLYKGHVGQTPADTVIAIMEDGTIECIYIYNGKLISTGKIEGISNVVRVEQIKAIRNSGNVWGGHDLIVAIQGNGKSILIKSKDLLGD